MFEPFHEVVSNVSKTVKLYEKEQDAPVIGVMPAYFPLELVYAAGGYPVQLWGNKLPLGKSDAYLQSYCCSIARSILELELMGGANMVKAYAFTSLCDTLINLREIYKRIIPKPNVELSIPITRTPEARRKYLENILKGVLSGLEEITGKKITPDSLLEAAKLHGKSRELQRQLYLIRRETPGHIMNYDFYTAIKAGFFLPAEVYNQMLQDLLESLENLKAPEFRGPKLILSGLVFDPIEIMKVFDDLGVAIVDDDFANGWRSASKEVLDTDDLTEGIIRFLYNPAPCCCIYDPENDRHTYMIEKVKKSDADGVLFWYIKFCEPDAFDHPQLIKSLKEADIPAATLDIELSMTNFDPIKTRVNAFCEMLEG